MLHTAASHLSGFVVYYLNIRLLARTLLAAIDTQSVQIENRDGNC